MAAVAALAPLDSAAAMQALRYKLLSGGHDVSGFHASEDRQEVRNHVFATLQQIHSLKAHVVFGDKQRIDPIFHSDSKLHTMLGRALIRHVIAAFDRDTYLKVVVVFDQALPKRKQGDFQGAIKRELKALHKPFHLYFHKMVTDMNGQIADYVAWSKFVLVERNEARPWHELMTSVKPTEANLLSLPKDPLT